MATRGVVLDGSYAQLAGLAARAEERGFAAVWVAETTRDSMIQATVVAGATSRVDVGTNVTLAFPRSPTVTAMQAWDLNELSGDRFVVGLGSQVKRIIEERFSAQFDRPAKRMAEYVEAMRTVWRMERGEDVRFDGEIYQVVRPGLTGPGTAVDRRLPRVQVAAVGPLMTRAAAGHADGIIGHPFTSDRYLTDDVLPRVEQALADAGRDRREFSVTQGVIVCVSDDRATAIREAKQQIAFYGTTPNYRGVFASYGDEALTDGLRRVFKDSHGDPGAMAAAVGDDVVDRYAVAGTPDEVRDKLAAIESHVDHVVLGGAWYQVPRERMQENLDAVLEVFSSP